MSRRIIPNAPGSPAGRETTVGWDAPLATFFGMAFDPPASGDLYDNEIQVFWVGGNPGEIPTVEALAAALHEHGVELPHDVASMLAADQAAAGDQSQGHPGSPVIDAVMGRRS